MQKGDKFFSVPIGRTKQFLSLGCKVQNCSSDTWTKPSDLLKFLVHAEEGLQAEENLVVF